MSRTLEVMNVHKNFGGVQAVRGVSLTLEEGRIVGLIGPNGSGKSTLLNLIAGVEKPTKGTIRVGGQWIQGMAPHRVVAEGIAKTHQIPKPLQTMTCRENVGVALMFGRHKERDPGRALRQADRLLTLVRMEAKGNVLAANLNVQERKRLEFARVLGTGATILLLDEIFAGLAPSELRESIALFAEVQKEIGFGALVVEHVMRAVLTLSEKVVVIEEGVKIAEGRPKDVIENRAVIEAYLGVEGVSARP
jgi:ABC-type branched-subunit amino acid transport system ATPase component